MTIELKASWEYMPYRWS